MVQLLISHGADGRPHPITRYSPLYVACHTGRIKIAEALVHKFPDLVLVETIEKLFPLHAACFQVGTFRQLCYEVFDCLHSAFELTLVDFFFTRRLFHVFIV